MTIRTLARATVSLAALSLLGAGVARAQSAQPAATDNGSTVDTIIVTAQKREQRLQDVPIVVTVAGAQLLRDTGVHDIKDLTVLTPGLLVTSTSSEASTTARIRGIGTVGDNPGLESSVGVVIDGVYRPRNGVGFGDLGDLARVEVLKGPQGTLFGKNTSAGVINIVTAAPSFKFGANGEATFGNFGEFGYSGSVTGPIAADKLAGSVFFANRERNGFSDVDVGKGPRTSREDFNRSFWTVRGQLYATPTAEFDARLIGDYSHRKEQCCVGEQIYNGPTAPLIAAFASPDPGLRNPPNPYDRLAFANRSSAQEITDGGVSLEMNYKVPQLNGAKLTSITAVRDWEFKQGQDSDFTTADIFYRPDNGQQGTQFQQFSQELRLSGTYGKLDYTVGGFYANELLKQKTALFFGTDYRGYVAQLFSAATKLPPATFAGLLAPSAPGLGQLDVYKQTDETFALFTNDTYHVTDKLELTVGLRYTNDDKSLTARYSNTDNGATCGAVNNPASPFYGFGGTLCQSLASFNPRFDGVKNDRSRSETATTGTVKLAYRYSPEYLGYLSYSRGYKSGGFNLDRVVQRTSTGYDPVLDTSFKGEFVDSYEVGLKTTLLDRKLSLNGAIFHQEFTNFQLNAFNGLYFTVLSVPTVTSTGFDADLLYRPFRGLSIQSGLTYANTRYTYDDARVLGPKCGPIAYGSTIPQTCSLLPGSRVSLAPLWSGSFSATYERPIGEGLVGRANLGVKYNSDYITGSDLNPVKKQKAYSVVDGRVGVGPENGRWSVELWTQNLFDTHYYQVAYDAPFQAGSYDAFLGQPRTYGVTLRAKY